MSSENIIRSTAMKHALHNAVQFNGKADIKAVIGKTIGELKKQGFSPKEIIPIVKDVIREVNDKKQEEQLSILENIAPDLLEREKKDKSRSLPDLPKAEKGKVVTRFPPEPNGYLHIGHAKASIVDFEYAKMYDGKFILRFDDTNPENAIEEFYNEQKKDLEWLGISWDDEYHTSDNIDKHYKLAEQLIKQGDAYVCTCESDKIHECRYNSTECDCRHRECKNNMDQWVKMLGGSLDDAVLRLKGDMCCDNTAMRDPTLFRIIEKTHPLQGNKYRVWPTYDFAGAIEDSLSGVTHPFRTKEYELRDEVYFKLLDLLNLRKPHLMEFARLNVKDMPVSKRKIKPLIDKGLVSGFDDVRLPTLRGLRRRGIVPEAIKNFVLSQGISKVESTVDFSILESENRKVIDSKARRFYFVPNPVKLNVKNAPLKEKKIFYHPTDKKMGSRTVKTKNFFYIAKNDVENLKENEVFRLKDLYNIKVLSKNNEVKGEYFGEDLISDSLKIQWTPEYFIKMSVFVPHPVFKNNEFNHDSLEEIQGYAEPSLKNTKDGEIIQFERFGFVRLEKEINGEIKAYFTHK